ncbi:hypothetical protein D9619_012653 [Psilocybe cf. subviscida]|uniref:Uncharacterized protein n=1 Tax=Psilocybe cf. subviscida TaxID=2480587 RepID=A0A8H5B756_9AGAR|nr:hypothetical protein D9619_012653 [Psilocybe cf. subviscida]
MAASYLLELLYAPLSPAKAIDKLRTLGSPSPGRSTPGTPSRRSPAPSQQSRLSQPPQIYHEDVGRSGSETEREESTSQNDTRSSYSHSSSSLTHQSTSSHAHTSSAISSSNRSSTAPPSQNSPYHRLRHLSAPESPQKARSSAAGSASVSSGSQSTSSHSPSRRRRNRTSMASMSQVHLTDFEEEDEEEVKTGTTRGYNPDRTLNERDMITQSALAAVASARRSPLENRRRSALPREFRSDLVDETPTGGQHTSAGAYASQDALDRDERRSSWNREEPVTPSRPVTTGVGRSATLRDTRRTGGPNPRWSSDDFRAAPSTLRDRRYTPAAISTDSLVTPREGRRQSLRGGSAESALVWSPGGRLLGEGLRAAGLSPRKAGEAGPSSAFRDAYRDQDIRQPDWSPSGAASRSRNTEQADQVPRASTSMSNYKYLDREDVEAAMARGRLTRGHKSTYSLAPPRERDDSLTRRTRESLTGRRERDSLPPDRAVSSLSHFGPQRSPGHAQNFGPIATPAHLQQDRNVPSPFGTRRYTHTSTATASGSQSQSQSEHTRLMLDSLAVFESQLAKLPPTVGNSGNNAAAGVGHFPSDVARSAQGVVSAAERLATLLKLSGARAMDAQVAAEVDTPTDRSQEVADIWARVAADYRDGSRTADELVRVLTAMLLGVGRIIRELNITGGSELGSPAISGRHLSEDSDELVASPVGHMVNGTGRESRASRQSWDSGPRDREREREEAFRRLDGGGPRPESVLARASPSTFQKLRDHQTREREAMETPPPPPPAAAATPARRPTTGDRTGVSGTFRRLFTPREQRERTLDRDAAREAQAAVSGGVDRKGKLPALDSQETVQQQYEPSPTPAGKKRVTASPMDRQRTLTPLAIPKPLPVLPSEAASRRPAEKSAGTPTSIEKANSTRSVRRPLTTRGERPSFPSITTPSNATTAITAHTVSNSPRTASATVTSFPLSRTASATSSQAQVTFSRPNLPPASTTLSDLQQQHMAIERKRTISTTSSNAEPIPSYAPSPIVRSKSGSETERDIYSSRTMAARRTPRASLDVQPEVDEQGVLANGPKRISATVHAADRSAATTILHQTTGAKRERRRTVTEIWARE